MTTDLHKHELHWPDTVHQCFQLILQHSFSLINESVSVVCILKVLRAVPGLSEPRVQVGSDLEFGRTWLQRAGCCADLSFTSRISVVGRGLVARSDGKKGREVGSYECGVGRISQQ